MGVSPGPVEDRGAVLDVDAAVVGVGLAWRGAPGLSADRAMGSVVEARDDLGGGGREWAATGEVGSSCNVDDKLCYIKITSSLPETWSCQSPETCFYFCESPCSSCIGPQAHCSHSCSCHQPPCSFPCRCPEQPYSYSHMCPPLLCSFHCSCPRSPYSFP